MKISFKNEVKQDDKITSEEVVNLILKQRKIKDIDNFLNPESPLKTNIGDFGFKSDIKKTLSLLEKIKKENKTIVVYTDYDADGITGGAILWETLYLLGFKVMPYVPHRKHEGYGFSIKGIDNVKKQFDPTLIISVDHGITKIKEVTYAKKLGIKVIITDHHLKQDQIPKAEAVFHIPELSGSGVAYFFSKMIFDHFVTSQGAKIVNNFQSDYLALAAIGTIADLVPLTGPSRSIVKYGLESFSKVKRPGLKHILQEAGISDKKITPYEVGFMIAPRINAVGRLEHAIDALRLLCTIDENRAKQLASHLGQTNRLRQDELEKSLEEAKKIMIKKLGTKQENFYSATCEKELGQEKDSLTLAGNKNLLASDQQIPKIIILISDHWNEGIIGLIASKIAEQFYRPTLVLTKSDGFYKGSARSIKGLDITNFLRSLKDGYLVDVGGHTAAAGFTVEKEKLEGFTKASEKKAEKEISDKILERKIEVDLKIPISKVNLKLAYEIEKLQPFGIGNPQPTFLSSGQLTGAQIFGKKNEHLKLFLGGMEFISFNSADQFSTLSRGQKIEIIYRLTIDRWGGRERLRGIVICLN